MPRKRGSQGDGTLYFHKGTKKWCAEIVDGKKADGSKNRRIIYGDTEREVRTALQRLRQEILVNGGLRGLNKDSVVFFLEEWLEQTGPLREAATVADYKLTLRRYIKPFIGDLTVEKFTASAAQKFITSLVSKHSLTPRQVKKAYAMLKAAFNKGLKMNKVDRNPMMMVETPKYEPAEQRILTTAEQQAFISVAKKDEDFGALFLLALDTGMRQGEVFGLAWSGVDLGVKEVSVAVSLGEVDGKRKVKSTKTKAGKRTIPFSDLTAQALWSHRKKLMAEGKRASTKVFADTRGGYIGKSNFHRDRWKPFLEAVGEALGSKEPLDIKFHELRHTAASRWLSQGVPIHVVSRWLGHASISITLTFYAHLVKEQSRAGADGFDQIGIAK